ncbi:Methyltransferase FkbM [Candidatus Nanopelagicaceae bacterium]
MLYEFAKKVNSSFVGKFIWMSIGLLPPRQKAVLISSILRVSLSKDTDSEELEIKSDKECLVVARSIEKKVIRLSVNHTAYLRDLVRSFDYYFGSVIPLKIGEYQVVDFSQPKDHDVVGFDLFPVNLPSLAEPISTNNQYISFAQLSEGDIVIDLGAYAGLSSIMFKQVVGKTGKVIAVEADSRNLRSLKTNFKRYEDCSAESIEVLEVAVWNHSKGITFTSDGNMGSSATEILGSTRGKSNFVPTMTLSDIATSLKLEKVSLIKCDIEGGELAVFQDLAFFNKYRPRIIIESHVIEGVLTSKKVTEDLMKVKYSVREVIQPGVDYPLLECVPN